MLSEESAHFPSFAYDSDVHTIACNDKTILLVGTAHISQHSVDLVEKVIRQEKPD